MRAGPSRRPMSSLPVTRPVTQHGATSLAKQWGISRQLKVNARPLGRNPLGPRATLAAQLVIGNFRMTTRSQNSRIPLRSFQFSLEYSALARLKIGTSGSVSFQSESKSWWAALALVLSPDRANVLSSSKCASAPIGSSPTRPRSLLFFPGSLVAARPRRRAARQNQFHEIGIR